MRVPVASVSEAPPQRQRTDGAAPIAQRRILVADDNKDAADSLTTMLSLMGHEARAAYDGLGAVETAATFRPDVIVLDVGMPRVDGYEAARRIRKEPWSNGVVLVALTGWGQEEDRAKAKNAGFDHHLTKPASIDAIVHLITEAPSKG